jgi:geranylgeranyl diphosphate synthase type II
MPMYSLEAFEAELEASKNMIEERLGQYFAQPAPDKTLGDAMRYSLLAGGKRLRPIITLQFARAAGGQPEAALAAACAVEMLHTYSLIHDDLPCMDDDALRRGKPTNHVVYGECVATLAGDALQAAAFETLAESDLPAETVVSMVKILSKAAGPQGICLGQAMDMHAEGKRLMLDELSAIHRYKTAALLIASAQLGVLAAGGKDNQLRAAEEYAYHLGLAFQVQDDILDYTATTEALGKPAGSDKTNNKTTFMTLMSLHDARHIVSDQTHYAIASLHNNFANTDFLEALAIYLEERKC